MIKICKNFNIQKIQDTPSLIVLVSAGALYNPNWQEQILNDVNLVEIISGLKVLKDESYLSFITLFENKVQ